MVKGKFLVTLLSVLIILVVVGSTILKVYQNHLTLGQLRVINKYIKQMKGVTNEDNSKHKR